MIAVLSHIDRPAAFVTLLLLVVCVIVSRLPKDRPRPALSREDRETIDEIDREAW